MTAFLSSIPASFKILSTSCCVNPKYSLNLVVAIVSETKLFVPVKILSFAIFRHPVITANFSAELSFNAALNIAFITSNISL